MEAALATALDAEVDARGPGWEGRVAVLAGELRARRLAREEVTRPQTRPTRREATTVAIALLPGRMPRSALTERGSSRFLLCLWQLLTSYTRTLEA